MPDVRVPTLDEHGGKSVLKLTFEVAMIAIGVFLGLAGASFAVGVGYLAGWTAPDRQRTVLGFYGLGTIAQSAAVLLGPLAAQSIG